MPRYRFHHILSVTLVSGMWLSQLPMTASYAADEATSGSSVSSVRNASGIAFSSNVPEEQYQELAKDLVELEENPITQPDSKLIPLLGIQDSSTQSLLGWLQERVHFIVEQDFQANPQVLNEEYDYPNPDEGTETQADSEADLFNDETGPRILMTNISSTAYKTLKPMHLLVSLFIPGIGDVVINSPRSGIIKVGEGLFNDETLGAGKAQELRNARRSFQLSVLFHEARHGDGNGAHLGFSHAICPEGHDYHGVAACDSNLNGPYSIQAHLLNSMNRSCEQCSIKEKELLKIRALDTASRVLKTTVDPKKDTLVILKKTQELTYQCESAKDLGIEILPYDELYAKCSQLPALKALSRKIKRGHYRTPIVRSTEWDPSPEGVFDPSKDVIPLMSLPDPLPSSEPEPSANTAPQER
jgi:hypothetical protein